MPQIIPIRDLKKTSELSQMCKDATEPIFITKYVFESRRERELVYVYKTVYDGDVCPNEEELTGGKFFTRSEIMDNIGKGFFTPNFEEEYLKTFG